MNRKINLLLISYTLPQVGGLETMTRLIAREFSRRGGICVRIVTPTPGEWDPGFEGVTVHRQPSPGELHQHYQWADVVFLNHFYLKLALPLLWMRSKPCVLSISGYTPPACITHWKHRLMGYLLLGLLHRANAVVACNQWCRKLLPVPSTVVPNPYDEERFALRQPVESRPGDILFAGRITHAKGCEELAEAYALLCSRYPAGSCPRLTVAGEGVLRESMEARFGELGISDRVAFLGPLAGDQVAGEMSRHRVLVVPSRYEEPVGIVALEGIASGCVVVGSDGGGLGETIDRFGFTFKNGDIPGLAEALHQALSLSDVERVALLQGRDAHLDRYRAANVARGYLQAVASVLPTPAKSLLYPA